MSTTVGATDTVLSANNLAFLLETLWSVRGKWYNFGLALGLPDTDLDAIHKCDNSPDECLRNVLKNWLHSGHPDKMSVLIDALKSPTVGHEQLADILLKNLLTADAKSETVMETPTAMQVSTMTANSEHMEDLKYQIEVDLDKIEKEFANVVTGVRLSLKRRKISAADIVAHVIQYQRISDSNKEKLKEHKSLDVVFIVLSDYWSFLECDILESIVTNYGTEEDHDKMERYKKNLESFCRRRLPEVPGGQLHLKGSSESHECQSMIVKLDIHDPRLSAIKEIKFKLCKILSIAPTAIEIKCVSQGCVEITFLIPQHIAKTLLEIPLTKVQVDALQAMSVVRITCGNFHKLFNFAEDSTVTKPVVVTVIDGNISCEQSPISVNVHTDKEAKQFEDLAVSAEGKDHVDTDGISRTLSEAAVDFHVPVLETSLKKHSKLNSADGAGNELKAEQEAIELADDFSTKRKSCYSPNYEYRIFLSQLSDMLSEVDATKIVFDEDLPKKLLGDENKSPSPLHVVMHLQMQGKATPEELSRIFSNINRQDLAKLVAKYAKKNPLTRKSSGPSAPKLEDTLNKTVTNCEVLLEQVDYLLKHAASKGNERIREVVLEAKRNLTDVVQHKLRYAHCLLSYQSQNEHSTQDVQRGNANPSSPTNSSRNSSNNEEGIYSTLPGPVKTTTLPTQTSDVTYYNYPVRDHQPLSAAGSSENGSGKSLFVTGSSKMAKPGPTTKPKPSKGKSHAIVKYTMGKAADDASPTDDSTYSYTGDSGFSDSRAFLKKSPPSSP